jgi:methyl-accepting chemotaxis protein
MNLRDLNIGSRLGGGFGLILVAASAVLGGALVATSHARGALVHTLQSAQARQATAHAMKDALLNSAVAVRNMGLQTQIEAVQKDEAAAKAHRAAYLNAKAALEAGDLSAEQRAPIARLTEIDRKMEVEFKEAVDMAAAFNTEQAAGIIVKKIDPLLAQAVTELAAFIELAKLDLAHATESAEQDARGAERAALGVGVLVILLSAMLAWRLTQSITRPLGDAERAAAHVASGELDFHIDASGRDEVARVLTGLQAMRDSLARVVQGVRQNSESVAMASEEIAKGNGDLSTRTEQQASALQQTAASMEELGTAVRHNADNARHASELAQGAAAIARKGGDVVGQVVQTMKGINESSRRIADIIGVIDGIAFQTNILALNAAVEAARAGEQGRGFAVVASEVRNLAQRSATAAREIKELISASVERVEQGSGLVDSAGSTMTDLVNAISDVTEVMAQISLASSEQSSGVAQVGQAVTQMDHNTQQNAALVEQSAAAAESLKVQARELVAAVSVFRLGAT